MRKTQMNKEEIVRKITMLCDDPNGFLVKLHVFNNFDEVLFGEILDALKEYNKVLQGESDINRHIAGFLVVLDSTLLGAAYHFEQSQHPDTTRVQKAHAEVINIMIELLPS